MVYAGNLGPAQSLETVILAAAELARRRSPVQFELWGTGTEEAALRARVAELNLSNVRFCGRADLEKIQKVSQSALAQIVILRDTHYFEMTVPSKLFFCMGMGTPLLYALRGEAAAIARESGGALEFEANSPQTLADAVQQLLAMPHEAREKMISAMREYYALNYSRHALLEKYTAQIRRLLIANQSSEAQRKWAA